MSVALPTGFEGLIITGGQPFEQRLPIGFEGIVLTFSDRTVFFRVVNGLGKPIAGLEITVQNASNTRSGFTDAEGKCNLDMDDTASITFKKDKTFRSKSYSRVTEGNLISYVYNVPMLE